MTEDNADGNQKPAAADHLFGSERETRRRKQRSGLTAEHPAHILERQQSENSVTQREFYRGCSPEDE